LNSNFVCIRNRIEKEIEKEPITQTQNPAQVNPAPAHSSLSFPRGPSNPGPHLGPTRSLAPALKPRCSPVLSRSACSSRAPPLTPRPTCPRCVALPPPLTDYAGPPSASSSSSTRFPRTSLCSAQPSPLAPFLPVDRPRPPCPTGQPHPAPLPPSRSCTRARITPRSYFPETHQPPAILGRDCRRACTGHARPNPRAGPLNAPHGPPCTPLSFPHRPEPENHQRRRISPPGPPPPVSAIAVDYPHPGADSAPLTPCATSQHHPVSIRGDQESEGVPHHPDRGAPPAIAAELRR